MPSSESKTPDNDETKIPQVDIFMDEESLLLLTKKPFEKASYSDMTADVTSKTTNEGEEGSDALLIEDLPSSIASPPSFWIFYYELLEQYPLLVKSITAFILLALADVLAQLVETIRQVHIDVDGTGDVTESSFLDLMRVLRFGVFGLLGAPWTHYYYDWLDSALPPTPQPWTWTTAIKVFIDQFIQAPLLLALIIIGMAIMEGEGFQGIWHDLQSQYMRTLIANWKLWIPATIVNIAFVQPILRVLYDNLVFFIWTIFLSMMLNDDS